MEIIIKTHTENEIRLNAQEQQGFDLTVEQSVCNCIEMQESTVRIITCHRTEASVTSERGRPLRHVEDAEAWAEPAEEAIQGVLQQQWVSRVGQQMQVH